MIIDLSTVDDVQYDHVGGKGYNLHRLLKAGLPVPRAAVIRPQSIDVDELINKLKTLEWIESASLYAVRSSGVGEDSQEKSWAGIFDSYLFIEPDNIAHHVQKVIDSMDATRYKKYSTESGIEIGSMAVIVQEMIHAEYAGVTFTTSPIEGDDRIALIEVVEGGGFLTYDRGDGVDNRLDFTKGDVFNVPGTNEHAVSAGPEGITMLSIASPAMRLIDPSRMVFIEEQYRWMVPKIISKIQGS